MTDQPTALKAPAHGGIRSLISLSAIIVAALVAATTALIRPYLETSTESTLLVAVFLSVTTTTSKSIYTACVGKSTAYVGKITKVYRGRRWRSILFVGLLAGLAACFLGIVGTSGVELAIGKEPSISPNGTQVIPISIPPAMGEEPSILPNGTQVIPISPPPPPPPLISYFYDSDGDKLGSGDPVKYERGSQPFGWVEQRGDKCPDIPGSLDYEGCPIGLLVWYFSDVDHDLIGDRIEIGSPTQYQRGFQPFGWVERSGGNCPIVPNADQKNNDHDEQGDACEDMADQLSPGSDLAKPF